MSSTEILCVNCGKPFVPKPRSGPDTKWCSWQCSMQDWNKRAAAEFTGHCAVCGQHTHFPHKYCSKACRVESRRTGREMGRYACAWCGKEVIRPLADAVRQKYCSPSCARRARAGQVVIPDVTPDFGHWLAGLADGEASFALTVEGGEHVSIRFFINLRADDRPMLETICATLGFGKVYQRTARTEDARPSRVIQNPQAVFACTSTAECAGLAGVFRKHPLRSKKARDFAIWATAIDLVLAGENGRDRLIELAGQLKAVRAYPSST